MPADLNAAALKQARWAESASLAMLTLPAMLLVFVLVLLPGAWLVWLSLQDKAGNFGFSNYLTILSDPLSLRILATSLGIAGFTTLVCVLVGYPLAYFLTQLPRRAAGYCLIAVLLPFWTSLLVRTYAWMVILQRKGVINNALVSLGVIDQPLQLANGTAGTIIGMVHIMLPFMVLPLYGSMRSVPPDFVRAAASLGAAPVRAFRSAFLPLTLPGLMAGSIMVFILCLGFYVTPALLGGGRVLMVSMRIDRSIELFADWGAGSAMGVILIVCVGLLALAARSLRRLSTIPPAGVIS